MKYIDLDFFVLFSLWYVGRRRLFFQSCVLTGRVKRVRPMPHGLLPIMWIMVKRGEKGKRVNRVGLVSDLD